MTVRECYEMIDSDYEGVQSRLVTDERIEKYLHKFEEGDYLSQILDSIGKENWEAAFRTVHSMKGVCMNLGFNGLFYPCDILCEELRECRKPDKDISSMVEDVKEQHDKVIAAIKCL